MRKILAEHPIVTGIISLFVAVAGYVWVVGEARIRTLRVRTPYLVDTLLLSAPDSDYVVLYTVVDINVYRTAQDVAAAGGQVIVGGVPFTRVRRGSRLAGFLDDILLAPFYPDLSIAATQEYGGVLLVTTNARAA